MKYFTPEWWALDVEDITVAMKAYRNYFESIRHKLTPDMVSLVEAISLHDSRLRELLVDAPGRSIRLVLDGWVNPWSPVGWHHHRRFTLIYQGVESFESRNGMRLFGDDLGYHELECLDDGAFEHRMLFASDAELIVRFADLQLSHIDWQVLTMVPTEQEAVLIATNLDAVGIKALIWNPPSSLDALASSAPRSYLVVVQDADVEQAKRALDHLKS
jgi:hypothetical protein